MRAVIQRVTGASVTVNGGPARSIGPGLVILLGVRETDDPAVIPKLAEKCAHLRIFEDEAGKLNRSAAELGYEALVVSNFTAIPAVASAPALHTPRGPIWRCLATNGSLRNWAARACAGCSTGSSAPICRSAFATTARSRS